MSLQLFPTRSLGYQVRRCHRRFDRLLSSRLARHGLDTGFWYYLRVLWHGDGVNQKYLSDATGVAENTTAKLITAMEKRGLVTRTRDRIDRRQLLIALTDSGRALEQELLPYAVEINSAATKGIEPEDVETCLSVLNRMSENLERELLNQPEG